MVLLGGRAAEEIIFGQDCVTTGACNDLQRSTQLITNMVTEYGMGEALGLLTLDKLGDSGATNQQAVFSECKSLISELYEEVKNILRDGKEDLEAMTSLLIEKETIYYEDIINIVGNDIDVVA